MKNEVVSSYIKRMLLQAEKYAPNMTSRAWGIWQDPWAEFLRMKVTLLTDTQTEVAFTSEPGVPSPFIKAGERALHVLWKRHLREGLEKVVMTQCTFDFLTETSGTHFIARTQLLENDREKILREARSGQTSRLESTVLIYGEHSKLVAQVHFTLILKTQTPLSLGEGEKS